MTTQGSKPPGRANYKVRSYLYLHAVLPALSALVRFDSVAATLITGSDGCIKIGVLNDTAVFIEIRNGAIAVDSSSRRKPDVYLLFLTHRHLCAFFGHNKWALPLLLRGASRVVLLKQFAQLGERLATLLEDASSTSPLYTRLSFVIAGLGLLPLARFDPIAQSVLETLPAGLAEFSIDDESIQPVWFENRKDQWSAGLGQPPGKPDVRVHFTDLQVANAALRNDLDTLAAIGAGRIVVEGLSPLADGLGLLMERLHRHLHT